MVEDGFYASGLGDRLIDSETFPLTILGFLQGEEAVLRVISRDVDTLIEVGCMEGRWLEWAMEMRKRYVGIDVVSRYIQECLSRIARMNLSSDQCQCMLGSATDLESLKSCWSSSVHPLVFFPFNSFGNMEDPCAVIESLRKSGMPFLVSSYDTSAYATACRLEYYANCQYGDLQCVENDRGVLFHSPDGLHSFAYHEDFLLHEFRKRGLGVEVIVFANIGKMYRGG
jgi:hypothetical protein